MYKEHHGFLFGVLGSFSMAIMIVFVRMAHEVPIPAIVFFRFLIGLLLFSPWFLRNKINFSLKHLPTHLMRDLSGLAAIYCYFFAVQKISLVNVATLSNTSPLFLPLVIFVTMKLILPKRRIFALIVGFVGVLFVLRPTAGLWEWANLVALASGLLAAIAFVYIRKLSRIESTQAILVNYFIVATLVSLISTIILWKRIEEPILWLYLLAIGVFGAIYQYFVTLAFTHAPASKASLTTYLGVVFAGIFGWAIWGEVPSLWDLFGVALIILASVITLTDQSKPRSL